MSTWPWTSTNAPQRVGGTRRRCGSEKREREQITFDTMYLNVINVYQIVLVCFINTYQTRSNVPTATKRATTTNATNNRGNNNHCTAPTTATITTHHRPPSPPPPPPPTPPPQASATRPRHRIHTMVLTCYQYDCFCYYVIPEKP